MDTGQTVFILSQLILGAIASFFAIVLWSKTISAAYMLLIIGALVAYAEIIYSILGLYGIGSDFLLIGSIPLFSFIMPLLRMSFFIAAFILLILKHISKKDKE